MRIHESRLGELANPNAAEYRQPLAISQKWKEEELLFFHESMLRIRLVEEAIAELEKSGEAKCPCHLGIGQEAAAVGIAHALRKTDRAFGAHRSHSHFLSMGGKSESLLAEVLGKSTGCSKGMGGSMHLFGKEFGFYGSVPIVSGTVPLAVGAGLAAKMDGKGDIAVAFFGDGASEEGVVHESLNLASQYELPVLFVCENNLYSSHLDITQRQPTDSIARFADAHRVDNAIVEGNDVTLIAEKTSEMVEKMRAGSGPAFIEAITYRWRGHVGADENVDVGVRRSAADIAAWKSRDPIGRLNAAIVQEFADGEERLQESEAALRNEIENSMKAARDAPYPEVSQNQASLFSSEY